MLQFDFRFFTSVAVLLLTSCQLPLQAQTSTAASAVTVAVSSSANPSTFAAPVTFTVTVSPPAAASPVPTGTVSAILLGPLSLGTATLDGAGRAVITVPESLGLLSQVPYGLAAGSDEITFSYSGDSRYNAADSKFTQFVNKANTATVAAITGNSSPSHLTATVSINEPSVSTVPFALPGNLSSSNPTGAVKFFNGTTLLGTAPLTPSGLFMSTASIPVDAIPVNLTAEYAGDDNYNGSTSPSTGGRGGGSVVIKVASSDNPSSFAEPVTLQIAVTPIPNPFNTPMPTGTVVASLLGLFNLGTVTLDNAGQGSLAIPANSISALSTVPWGLAAGSDSITLTYSGDQHYASAQTSFTENVNKASTVTNAAFASASTNALSITATVSNSEPSLTPIAFALPGNGGSTSPTGNIQFLNGSSVVGTAPLSSSGHLQSSATLTLTQPLPSSASIVAVYNGDANYLGSTSPPATRPASGIATIVVASSVNPSTFAEPVTFKVTVAPSVHGGPTPSGTIQAAVLGTDRLGAATLDASGNATFTVPPQDPTASPALPWGLATGSNVITITYSGDSNYQPGKTTFTQLVNKADSATTILLTPGVIINNMYAVYARVGIDEASVSKVDFGIPASGILSTSPTGNLTFFSGTTMLGTGALTPAGLFQANASVVVPVGTGPIRAVFNGDSNYNPSSSPGTGSAGAPVTVTLAASANPVIYGAAFTVAATVMPATAGGPTPTGTVTFYDGQSLGWTATLDSSGRASLPIPIPIPTPLYCAPLCLSAQAEVLGAGTHIITVTYSGDANYAAGAPSAGLVEQINKAPTNTTLSSAFANVLPPVPGTLTATVADSQPPANGPYHFLIPGPSGLVNGNPTGTVQFFGGSTPIGTATLSADTSANVSAHASLSTTNTSATLSAAYSGDDNFQASSSPTPATTTVKLSSSANPSNVGQSITLTATMVTSSTTPAPTGSVDFLDGSALLGKATVSGGVATLAATFSTAGTHSLSANYNGDANYLASSSGPYIQAVMPIGAVPGVLTITSSAATAVFGQLVTFTSQVQGTGSVPPTGQIVFLDGGTGIGAGNISLGSAELVINLPAGSHQISAVYAGDSNWPAARSQVLVEVVNRALTVTTLSSDLTITVSAVPPGQGTPTGTVQLVDSGSQSILATATLSGGSAKITLPGLTAAIGNGVLQAVYLGDTNFAPSSSTTKVVPVIVNAVGVRTTTLAPDEVATIYGTDLETPGATAISPVTVTDSAGAVGAAYLYYVSSTQIDFVVPAGAASGSAILTVGNFNIFITIAPVIPVLYAANASGQGVAAAQIVRVHPDGTQSIDGVATLDPATGLFHAAPIAFGADSLYLVLYGTGLRHRSSQNNVTCSIGGTSFAVAYAGAQSQYPGLDQIVVPLSSVLAGAGTVNVVVTADGQSSNSVSIAFQ